MTKLRLFLLCLVGLTLPFVANAQTQESAPVQPQERATPLYDGKLLRLSEVLGSLHYLRNLCGEESTQWRDRMNALILAEKPNEMRKARLYSAFNGAYRSFSESYYQCTPAAIEAIERYTKEGAEIADELVNRYGN